MRQLLQSALLLVLMLILVHSGDAQWECQYATWDNSANGTGHQVIGMGVIKENMFVALVTSRGVRSFMIPYVNADSGLGRKYFYGYGSAILTDVYQVWTDAGFDQVTMNNAFALKAMPDSLIYVASNDAEHNVLVFKYTADTVTVVEPFPRQVTGANSIFGIDVDNNGYVYVCTDTTTGVTADIKVYRPIGQWTPAGHQDAPITTIDLPDGMYKGIAVTANGNAIFISDYMNRKVIKYVGTPATGYTLATGFNFALGPQDTLSAVPPKNAGPIGLAHLASKNILAVAVDSLFKQATTTSYAFGRVYLLNGNTGARISTDTSMNMIDQAAWAFSVTGSYASRGDGDIPGNVSSYASTIDVKWDAQGNLYSQSYYGWTVEKWKYNGTLPSFTTAVEEMGGTIPDGFSLSQNYPNPFNPTTTIEFSLPQSGFVSLRVFDLLGQEIATLANEERPAGTYQATFDASSLPSGTYFYMLKAGAYSEVKKMVILK